MTRLRDLCRVNPGVPGWDQISADENIPFLPMERVWTDRLDFSEHRPKAEVATGYTRFAEGDLLLPKITPTFEAGRASVALGLPARVGAGTTELHVLRPHNNVHARWLLHFVNHQTFLRRGHSDMYGVAGQKRISEEFVKNYPLELPSLDEQRRIADYLDTEIARIDELIAEQRWLIHLVDEHRNAILDDVVWRDGESLIPLGKITPFDRPIMYGIVLPGPNVPHGVLIVKGGDVRPDRLRLELLCRTTPEIEERYARARLRAGDTIRGSIGDAAVIPAAVDGANITQDVARIAPGDGFSSDWLLYAVTSPRFFSQMEAEARGATIRGVNIWSLKRGRVPWIDLERQRRQTAEIDHHVNCAATVRHELQAQIALLQEHRQALITHAVSQGIDGLPRVG